MTKLQTREIPLPDDFVSYPEARKNAFLKLKKLKEEGRNVIGIFCAYTPYEIIDAAGAVPVSLCAVGEENIPFAETDLPKNLCPLIKASYGIAIKDRCPFFYFSDMIMGETTCDGKKKMYELMDRKLKHTHVFNLPNSQNAAFAEEMWRQEVVNAARDIEDFFGVEITEDKLKKAIKLRNRERKAMMDFFETGKLKPSPISGYEMVSVSSSNDYAFDLEKKIAFLEKRTGELKDLYETQLKGKPSRPRIIVTGCPSHGVIDKLIRRIEDLGADIVCFDSCNGAKEKRDTVDENMDPYTAIAQKYLRINCSVMSPNEGRYKVLGELIDDYQADGVIELVLVACHTFAIEAASIKEFVTKEKNIPYLEITTDYSASDQGQIDTRLGAFIEMLE